jgi:hypothetical protein
VQKIPCQNRAIFFFERPLGVDHAEDPLFLLAFQSILVHPFGLVAHHDIVVELGLRLGM